MTVERLDSARLYFDKVLRPAKDQFFVTTSNFLSTYALANSLYHFHEWLWHYHETALSQKYPGLRTKHDLWKQIVETNVPKAGYVRDLNNVSKHVELRPSGRSAPSSPATHSANTYIQDSTYGTGGYGVGRYSAPSVKIASSAGDVLFDDVANDLFQFWEALIDELDPPHAVVFTAGTPSSGGS